MVNRGSLLQGRCQAIGDRIVPDRPETRAVGEASGAGGGRRARPIVPDRDRRERGLPIWQAAVSLAVTDPRGLTALARRVAASVDAPVALYPHLDELFSGLPSLGSTPRRTAAMLEGCGLRRGSRAVDLACGKGAFAMEVARRFGWRVLGVDACGPFVERARRSARRRGLEKLCEFRVGDVRGFRAACRFDAAFMLGLDPVARASRRLRGLVRPGGVYVIDDAVGEGSGSVAPTRAAVRRMIEQLGDTVVGEDMPARHSVESLNARLYERLRERARALRRREKGMGAALDEFLERQRHANRALAGPLRPCVWMIRRGAGR